MTLLSAALGIIGTLVLFYSSYALQPLSGSYFGGPETAERDSRISKKNKARVIWQRVGLAFLCASFVVQGLQGIDGEDNMWGQISAVTKGEVFGFLAALVWLASAFIPLPSNIWIQARVGEGGPNERLETLVRRLKNMSWLNALAAVLTALSVFFPVHG
jgi:hypothetical protein